MGIRYLDDEDIGQKTIRYLDEPAEHSGVDFSKVKEPSWLEQQIAKLPNIPQSTLNTAAGMLEVGGLLKNAPRLQNVATEDGYRTLGRILDPATAVVGAKVFQGVTQIPKIAAMSPLAQSAIGGAASGAATGNMSGEPEGALIGAGMGGALGPALIGAGKLGGKTYDFLSNLTSGAEGQVTNYLRKVFPDAQNRQAAIDTLNQLSGNVPGEMPTSGRAAVSGTQVFPQIKALSEKAQNALADLFENRRISNEAARAAPLEEMAYQARQVYDPTTGAMLPSPAQALRSQVTAPLFESSASNQVSIYPRLERVLSASQVSPLDAMAAKSADQARANMLAGGSYPAPVGGMGGYTTRGPDSFRMMPDEPYMTVFPQRSISDLQGLKNELTKKINDLGNVTDAPSKIYRGQLQEARSLLNQTMTAQSPDYKQVMELFRQYSTPQNRGEVANVLLQALKTPGGKERSEVFLNAMQNAPATIKKAGEPRFQTIEQVMGEQMPTINAIKQSEILETAYKNLRKGELPQLQSKLEELESVTPGLLKAGVTAFRKAAAVAGSAMTKEAEDILNRSMLNPKDLANLLDKSTPAERSKIMQMVFAKMKEANKQGLQGAAISIPVNAPEYQ